jgi:hypothetical protein
MSVKPGDKIRILEDRLQSAGVKVGDILTVTGFAAPDHSIVEAYDPDAIDYTWWFSASREGAGFEKVED